MIAALGCVALLLCTAMAVQLTAARRSAWKLHDAATVVCWVLVACTVALVAAVAIGAPS